MNIKELASSKIIAIVGMPTTGKTTLAKELKIELNIPTVYHTDDYLSMGFTLRQTLLRSGMGGDQPFIVEGTMVYDLLAEGVVVPDVIVYCSARAATRQLRYERRGKNFFAGKPLENRLVMTWNTWRSKNPFVKVIDHQTD